jgi:hypothetical protein
MDIAERPPRQERMGSPMHFNFTPAGDDEMALTWHHFPTVFDRAARCASPCSPTADDCAAARTSPPLPLVMPETDAIGARHETTI